jgi:hypothetical protein
MRKCCKECPWTTNSQHSKSWPDYVNVMEKIGQVKSKKHACHMITKDTWGYKEEISDSNVCIGSLQVNGNL